MEIIKEEWRDIPDYEGLYQVSNFGKVKSLNYRRSGKEQIMKPKKTKDGYLRVNLSKYTEMKNLSVHKLVALAFIKNDNPIEKTEINHVDENKENNHVDNLCWITHKENCNYGTRNERVSKFHKGKPKTKEHKQKISKAQKGKPRLYNRKPILQFTKDMVYVREWDSAKSASIELNISSCHITNCLNGRVKSSDGYCWKYK